MGPGSCWLPAQGSRGWGCPGSDSTPVSGGACRTFFDHAHGKALLEAAELAPVPPPLVHRAVFVGQADVLGVLLHCALQGQGGARGTSAPGKEQGQEAWLLAPSSGQRQQ